MSNPNENNSNSNENNSQQEWFVNDLMDLHGDGGARHGEVRAAEITHRFGESDPPSQRVCIRVFRLPPDNAGHGRGCEIYGVGNCAATSARRAHGGQVKLNAGNRRAACRPGGAGRPRIDNAEIQRVRTADER